MKIFEYTKRLPAVFERREVLSLLYQVREALQGGTLETVRNIETILADDLKSSYGKILERAFSRHVNYNGNFIPLIRESLENLEAHLRTAEGQIKKKFGAQITNRNVSYDRAVLLRFVESAEFYVDYSNKLFHRLLAEEVKVWGSGAPQGLSKGQLAYLDEGLSDYVRLFKVMLLTEREFTRVLEGISSAEVDESTHEVAVRSLGRSGTDPVQLFSGVGLESRGSLRLRNPIYSAGRAYAELQVARHKGRKETIEALQLRLQEWKELAETGKASPKLQRLIDHTEKRVEKLDYQIAKFEEENAYTEDDYAY